MIHETTSRPSKTHQPCDACGSSDAKTYYDDGHGWCFACETYFAKPKGAPHVHNPGSNFTLEYLSTRGINQATMEFYDVKTRCDGEGKPIALGFRYSNGSYKVRDLSEKRFYTEKGPSGEEIGSAGLFGKDKFSAAGGRSVTITEGELDALSIFQVLGSSTAYPVVSVQSSVVALRDCSLDRSWLNSFEKIYLAFDGDEPGRRACSQVAQLFDPQKVYHVRFSKRKDGNEYLAAGEGDELKKIWWNSRIYQPENIKSGLDEFVEVLQNPPKYGVAFPFKKLTKMTYGIRMGESIMFCAQEKVGKTEVMHFIEHKLLKETDANVAAIYLEEPIQRHLQALASIELQKPLHLPDSGVSQTDTITAFKQVVTSDDRLFVYSHFGSDDPDVLLDRIRYLVAARNVRYVLFDNITVSVTGLGEEKERIILDYLSTRLEMLAKELNFALIFVSHLNDAGQTRGSRNLGKVCDTRIDITRDLQANDPVVRRTWNLTLAYSRFSGESGPAGRIVFDPTTYSFTEELGFADNDNQENTDGHAGLPRAS